MGLLTKIKGKSGLRENPSGGTATSARFRGVQVITNPAGCCRAAEAIGGQRFLAHQVPRLPLEDCDSADCYCTYQLFDDRRTDSRRASDTGFDLASELHPGENRRVDSSGRRQDDY